MKITRIKLQLLLSNVTQAEVARKANVSSSYVSRCVRGKKRPSKKIIKALCDLTELPESYFVEKNESKEVKKPRACNGAHPQ